MGHSSNRRRHQHTHRSIEYEVQSSPIIRVISKPSAYYAHTIQRFLGSLLARGAKKATVDKYEKILEDAPNWLGGYPHTWTVVKGQRFLEKRIEDNRSINYALFRQAVIDSYVRYMNDRENGFISHTIDAFGSQIISPFTRGHRIQKSVVRLMEPNVRPAYESEVIRILDHIALTARTAPRRRRAAAAMHHMMFTLMVAYGLRCCEVTDLKKHHLRKHHSLPEYGRFATLDVVGKAKPFGESRPRTIYTVPHFDSITRMLEEYVGPKGPSGELAEDDFLFLNERGQRMSPNYVSHLFTYYRRAAGLPEDCTTHGLRRFYGVHLILNGVDVWFVSDQYGHESEATTWEYIRFATHFRVQHVRRLRRLVLGPDGADFA